MLASGIPRNKERIALALHLALVRFPVLGSGSEHEWLRSKETALCTREFLGKQRKGLRLRGEGIDLALAHSALNPR